MKKFKKLITMLEEKRMKANPSFKALPKDTQKYRLRKIIEGSKE